MDDLISRQQAIDGKILIQRTNGVEIYSDEAVPVEYLKNLPTIQPVATDTNVGDKISKFIDDLEKTFAYIREREGGDSVCGLCEYDGAYIGESGDWCNECPGFNRDDCFKLSDETRKKWTDEIITICKHVGNNSEIPNSSDCISRQAAIDVIEAGRLTKLIDAETAINGLRELPPAQPETHEERAETHACDLISRQAVKHLDIFTKTYCRDKSVKDDLVFRCNQCDFQLPDGTCLVKTMARKLCPDYREFGSMGDL